jgi:hypothetical protein
VAGVTPQVCGLANSQGKHQCSVLCSAAGTWKKPAHQLKRTLLDYTQLLLKLLLLGSLGLCQNLSKRLVSGERAILYRCTPLRLEFVKLER